MWVFVEYLMVGAVNTIAGFALIIFCLEILDSLPASGWYFATPRQTGEHGHD